jgi:predicted ArsR family transcriptional regulator
MSNAGQQQRWPRNRQREHVLHLVRDQDTAVDAAELADRTGLHVTTVRFHLDALCAQGALARTRINHPGVGRPRTGYVALQRLLDYQVLAEVLAEELGETPEQRQQRAERAGRRWGDRIAATAASEGTKPMRRHRFPAKAAPGDDRTAAAVQIFEKMGFAPGLVSGTGREQTIHLHGCPVRELARSHPEVTCSLHLGLLRALHDDHAELEPFVEPELCIAKVVSDA